MEALTANTRRHVQVALQDMGGLVNGLTDPLNEVLQLFLYPPPARMNLTGEDWPALLSTHEYTHELNLDLSGGLQGLLFRLGGNSLNFNLANPPWAVEGIAVYSESQVSPFSGRLNDGFMDAQLLAAAMDGKFPSLMKGTFEPWEYPGGTRYITGGGFHSYLAKTYGQDKLTDFYKRHSSIFGQFFSPVFPALGMDHAARKAFGKSIPDLWRDWRKEEEAAFRDDSGEGESLTHRGWDIGDVKVWEGKVYLERMTPVKTTVHGGFTFNEIQVVDPGTGRTRVVVSTTSGFAGALKFSGGKLYYSTQEYKRGYSNTTGFGYWARLYEKDLKTGGTRFLFTDQFRAYERLPGGDWIYSRDRNDAFGSVILRWSPSDGKSRELFRTDLLVDELVGDGDRLVVTAQGAWENYGVYRVDLNKQALTPLVRTPFLQRVDGLYGDQVLFTANYGKRFSIYEYDLKSRKVTRLTRGPFASTPALDARDGTLYYSGLTARGNDLFRLKPDPQAFSLPKDRATIPPTYELQDSDIRHGGYGDNLARLAPRILHIPYYYDIPGEHSAGIALAGGDAVYDLPAYTVLAGWDIARKRPMSSFAAVNQFAYLQYADAFDQRFLQGELFYPLALQLNPGLSSWWVGLRWNLHERFARREWTPYSSFGFQWAKSQWGLTFQSPMERKSWGSLVDRTGLYTDLTWRQYLKGSEFRLWGRWLRDRDNPDLPFLQLRGYQGELLSREGEQGSLDFSAPILKIRQGLWNPCFYVEDLVLDLFTDRAWGNEGRIQWSYGAELHLESSLTTAAVPLDLGLRFAETQGKDWELVALVSYNFNLGIGSKVKGPPSEDFQRRMAHPWVSQPSVPMPVGYWGQRQ